MHEEGAEISTASEEFGDLHGGGAETTATDARNASAR